MRYVVLALLLMAGTAQADCETEQTLCETQCKVKHLTDEVAATGCKSKCIASRAACSAEKGAEAAVDMGKDAWKNTKSFIKGVME